MSFSSKGTYGYLSAIRLRHRPQSGETLSCVGLMSNRRDLEDERDDIGVFDQRAFTTTKSGKQVHNFAPSL